jgi:hypothetical protein
LQFCCVVLGEEGLEWAVEGLEGEVEVIDDIECNFLSDDGIDVSLFFFVAVFGIIGLELIVLEFDKEPDVLLVLFGD